MSPILVRPVREQLEHDRLIRLLQARFKRKFEAAMNPGNEQNAPVGTGPLPLFPDLVLLAPDRGRRLQVVVEVETGESVNHLEALAQWAHLSKVRAAFHLYVPAGMVDVARHLCEDNQIHVEEIWSYHIIGDEPRFTLVHRSKEAQASARKTAVAKPAAAGKKPAARAAKPVKTAKAAKAPKASKPPKRSAPAKATKPSKAVKSATSAKAKNKRK